MNYCTKCGTKLSEGAKFCPKCGKKFIKKENSDEDNIKNAQNLNENNDTEKTQIINNDSDADDTQIMNKVNDADKTQIMSEDDYDKTQVINENNDGDYDSDEDDDENCAEEDNGATHNNSHKSKLSKIIICLAAAALIAFFAANKIGNYLNSPDKMITSFQNAVSSNSVPKMKKVLSCSDDRLEMNDDNLKVFLSYFKDNPSYLHKCVDSLKNQEQKLKVQGKINQNHSENIVYLEKYKTPVLKITKYKIYVKPLFIKIHTKIKNAEISLNAKQILKTSSDDYSKEIGPLMPGKYVIKSSYKDEFINVNEPKEVDLINPKEDLECVELLQNLKKVTVSTDDSENNSAQLYVNGKNTGIIINGEAEYGPVTNDTNIYAVVKKDGRTFKSEDVKVGENSSIYLNVQSSMNEYYSFKETFNSFRDNIDSFMESYASNFTDAVNYGDFSYIESYLFPQSKFYNETKKCILNYYKQGIYESLDSCVVTKFTNNEDFTEGTLTDEEIYEVNDERVVLDFVYTYKYNQESQQYQLTSIKRA